MTAVTIGIDPGLDGAIAVLVDGELADVHDMPTWKETLKNGKTKRHVDGPTLRDILQQCRAHCERLTNPVIAIEKAQPRPTNGALAAFKSGEGWGTLVTVSQLTGWLVTYVNPQDWRKEIGFTGDKDDARELAARMWPEMASLFARKKDDGRAEACLIAHWRTGAL